MVVNCTYKWIQNSQLMEISSWRGLLLAEIAKLQAPRGAERNASTVSEHVFSSEVVFAVISALLDFVLNGFRSG